MGAIILLLAFVDSAFNHISFGAKTRPLFCQHLIHEWESDSTCLTALAVCLSISTQYMRGTSSSSREALGCCSVVTSHEGDFILSEHGCSGVIPHAGDHIIPLCTGVISHEGASCLHRDGINPHEGDLFMPSALHRDGDISREGDLMPLGTWLF